MERLKHMKENLMCCVEGQMGKLQEVDSKELGEAIDMIKDLEEAIYYATITKAMEEKEKEQPKYYTINPDIYYRDMDRDLGRMYYSQGSGGSNSNSSSEMSSGSRGYYEMEYPVIRDSREGRSGSSRRMYMEAKEMQQDKAYKMKELESYMQELTQDIVEMIEDASPEEKQFLEKKISTLATKLGTMNRA